MPLDKKIYSKKEQKIIEELHLEKLDAVHCMLCIHSKLMDEYGLLKCKEHVKTFNEDDGEICRHYVDEEFGVQK